MSPIMPATLPTVDPVTIPGPDLALLSAALRGAGLPDGDIALPGRLFWRLGDGEGPVAFGGLEVHGADGLIRSVVVNGPNRGTGLGRIMVEALEHQARLRGVTRLWLLTTGAEPVFTRLGYGRADRAAAPPAIAASAQFAGICPASAVCMMRTL